MNLLQFPAATLLVDREGQVVGCNPASERLLGWSTPEVLGQPYPFAPAADQLGLAQRLEHIWQGETHTGLQSWLRHDGAALVLTLTDGPLRDDEGQIIAMIEVLTDVTPWHPKEARALEEARRQRAEQDKVELQLREGQRLESLGVLAGGMAHDFNNLLTLIMGYASLAEPHLGRESAAREYLRHIEEASIRAADLCKQMLAYAGKGRYVVGPLDLNEAVRKTTELLLLSISSKTQLRQNLRPGLPLIHGDANQVQQVILNLVLNAAEALVEGEGAIDIETGVFKPSEQMFSQALPESSPKPSPAMVYLEVRDNGSGIDSATIARIFDPFFTTKFTGRGLGLSAVQGIVRSHHGIITVDSTPGKGSTFRVLLPVLEGPATLPRVEPPWRGEGTVLVIDDEEGVRSVAARMLAGLGFEVLEARDGQEGLEIFQEQADNVRLVLLDLTMPRLGGEQTLEQLHARRPDLPVILMSGYHEQELFQRIDAIGVAEFLQKPFKQEQLREKVRALLS